MMITAYVGLGSNLSDPHSQVLQAISQLKNLEQSRFVCASSLYLTPPWGIQEQPPFINAVVMIMTKLTPYELLDALLAIELARGRVREERYGPRIIDCDILLYGQQKISSERLTIPHPYLTERSFVVVPLFEIAPALILPCGLKLCDVMKQFANEKIEKLTLTSEESIHES
ncbi:MAG: 2-amino-4-hydroxy-6-hydroxymethyldihydropteridine diphosphokinase [Candidatus Berkiella sp.]